MCAIWEGGGGGVGSCLSVCVGFGSRGGGGVGLMSECGLGGGRGAVDSCRSVCVGFGRGGGVGLMSECMGGVWEGGGGWAHV